MGRRLEKNYSFCEPRFLSIVCPICILEMSYLYIGQNVLQVGPKYTRKMSQTKSIFPNGAPHAVWKKNDFVTSVFRAYLDYNLSDKYGALFRKKLYVLQTMVFESKQTQKTWFTKRVVFFQTANLSDI